MDPLHIGHFFGLASRFLHEWQSICPHESVSQRSGWARQIRHWRISPRWERGFLVYWCFFFILWSSCGFRIVSWLPIDRRRSKGWLYCFISHGKWGFQRVHTIVDCGPALSCFCGVSWIVVAYSGKSGRGIPGSGLNDSSWVLIVAVMMRGGMVGRALNFVERLAIVSLVSYRSDNWVSLAS